MVTDKNVTHLGVSPLRILLESKSFSCSEIPILLRLMEAKDYPEVRNLIPEVSTCSYTLHSEDVQAILSFPTYYPWCAHRVDTNELVGFAEIYVLPHLGRRPDARLERLIVSSTFRNKGLASKMCRLLFEEAKSRLHCGRIDLTVEDETARHIYQDKFNFKPVSTSVLRLSFS